MQNALEEMDTEWDRYVAKILIVGDKSHTEIERLGLSDKGITKKFTKLQTVIEELQNTKLAAEDMVSLQLRSQIEAL